MVIDNFAREESWELNLEYIASIPGQTVFLKSEKCCIEDKVFS